jgi:hypothetical protein
LVLVVEAATHFVQSPLSKKIQWISTVQGGTTASLRPTDMAPTDSTATGPLKNADSQLWVPWNEADVHPIDGNAPPRKAIAQNL